VEYGIVSDIREFTLHDGPGIRTTVFLKGCPLRCQWCHNPETMSPAPQRMESPAGSRVIGQRYSTAELAALLLPQAEILASGGGGVTFSGGEPLLQDAFLCEVIEQLRPMHVLLDTSGFAPQDVFRRTVPLVNLVYFDLKLVDAEEHRRYTGQDNRLILENLAWLADAQVPFVIRVPLVPGVTDTPQNLAAIASTVRGMAGLEGVELLPYNPAAGGKYAGLGMEFHPSFDEQQPVNTKLDSFISAGIPAHVVGTARP
jgi:pyruvate formate lyase activating enzyme